MELLRAARRAQPESLQDRAEYDDGRSDSGSDGARSPEAGTRRAHHRPAPYDDTSSQSMPAAITGPAAPKAKQGAEGGFTDPYTATPPAEGRNFAGHAAARTKRALHANRRTNVGVAVIMVP